MKKIIILVLLLFSFTFSSVNAYKIETTQWIPWICWDEKKDVRIVESWKHKVKLYKCNITVKGSMILLWEMIKYAAFIAWLLWVMFIVYNGILYSMWWADENLKAKSKERIVKTLIWLIVLLMSWYILQFLAPWIYK